MTHVLVAVLALPLGWMLGIFSVSIGLRKQLRVLDLERAELANDRQRLRESQKAHYDELVAWIAEKDADKPVFAQKQSRFMA